MDTAKRPKKLRSGITSGSYASAAAKAAVEALLFGISASKEHILTPSGIGLEIPVEITELTEEYARAVVIKDSGDDPDVTNGAEIYAVVSFESSSTDGAFFQAPNLWLKGGKGIGIVTKTGLEQPVGSYAINSVPRKMIFSAVREICDKADFKGNIFITIEMPRGEELAKKTFNPKLGIEGGLSILGTTGILEPMSEKAIVATIETQIRQLSIQKNDSIILAPGNYGLSYLKQLGIAVEGAVKCSNFIGEALDLAVDYGIKNILLVGNIGKLIKLAGGIMNTHSRYADCRAELMAVHCIKAGGTRELFDEILSCITTEQMLEALENAGLRQKTIDSLCVKIQEYVDNRLKGEAVCGVILFSEKYGRLGKTAQAEEIEAVIKNSALR